MYSLRRRAKKKVMSEFYRFRCSVLRYDSNEQIWDSCHRIYFCSCVKEYFEYNRNIPDAYLNLVMAEPEFLNSMWNCYLKEESLAFARWEDIEVILECLLMKWRIPQAG